MCWILGPFKYLEMLSKLLDIYVWSSEERSGLQVNLGVSSGDWNHGSGWDCSLRKYRVKTEKEVRLTFE